MRWVALLLALLPVMIGSGGSSWGADTVPAIGTSDGIHRTAFLPAGPQILPAAWSEGSAPPPRWCSRGSRPVTGTNAFGGPSAGPGGRVHRRSTAHLGLAARHALDRAGRRAFLLGTPPPLRSV